MSDDIDHPFSLKCVTYTVKIPDRFRQADAAMALRRELQDIDSIDHDYSSLWISCGPETTLEFSMTHHMTPIVANKIYRAISRAR